MGKEGRDRENDKSEERGIQNTNGCDSAEIEGDWEEKREIGRAHV